MSEIIGFFHTFYDIVASLERMIQLSDATLEYQKAILSRLDRLIVIEEDRDNKEKISQ